MQALDGVRILDLSGGVAGPLGVLQLAEHGADVVKVEPPRGRPDRGSPASRVANRSRRSVTIDLTHPDGAEVFRALCARVDVLVEAFSTGTMARFGLDYESLRGQFPRLVYCSIPAWPSGTRYADRPGYEALVHARSGQHWENPSFRRGPVFPHGPVASHGAMFLVPIGIMAALVARDRTGRGQHVEVSLLQGSLSLTTQIWNWTDQGQFPQVKTHPPGMHQVSIFECADGEWIHAATMAGVSPTRTEASVLGLDVPNANVLFMTAEERAEYEPQIRAAYKQRNRAELIDEFRAARLGAEAIVAPHEKFSHPQLQATGSVVEVDDPEIGVTTQIGVPLFLEKTPGAVRGAQPLAGAHTDEVLRDLGYADAEIAVAPYERGDLNVPGPLEGLRVIDFGQYFAGPFGPMLLADLGADVIKVEPVRGDAMRPVVGIFMGCQRGKRDIALDLKQPEGLRIALELVATADMVHHNMTLGTADRLGIGYEPCKAARPDILYCNSFMYGAIGPLAHLGGLDPLAQAACGLEWEQGPVAEGNPPQWNRYGHCDTASAMLSVLGLLIALFHRNQTGDGQSVWTSLLHASMLYTADSFVAADGTPSPRPTLDREQMGLGALYRLYETQDGWLQLAAVKEQHWRALCGVLGRDEFETDPRFATSADRERHRSELTTLLQEAFLADIAVNWRRALDAAGVPCEVSVDTADGETVLFDDELFRLGLVAEYDHPIMGRVRQFGNLITFSDTPCLATRATPMLGQHTREILAELGYDEATIDEYRDRCIVSWPDERYDFRV